MLEAVVYSHRAADALPLELAGAAPATLQGAPEPAPSGRHVPDQQERTVWQCRRDDIRRLMWNDAGIVRTTARLDHALAVLSELRREIEADCWQTMPDPSLIELRNLAEVARLVVHSARARQESRGLHYNTDFPYRDNERCLRDTVLELHGFQENPD